MSGSESRNVRNVSPFSGIDATAAKETLLFLFLIEQVLTFFNDTGLFPVGVTRSGDLCMWAQIALRYQVAWSPLNGSVYHLSADNRACNLSLKMSDVSMASVIEEYLIEDNPQYSSRSIVLEYLVYWRLQLARHCYLSGDKMDAIVLLNKTRRTKLFKMKWLKLLLAILLPLQITKSILFIKNKIKYVMLQNRS